MLVGNDEEEQWSACLKPERKTVQSADDWTTTMREDQLTVRYLSWTLALPVSSVPASQFRG